MKLVIGNKNYSSWSMRPWVFLSEFEIPFQEEKVPLFQENTNTQLEQYNSDYKVPILVDGDITIWDSLAIMEYVNETYLDNMGVPQDKSARALCRSMCAEMHSSFFSLREELGMNIKKNIKTNPNKQTITEINRIEDLWEQCLTEYSHNGPYLLGSFSMADAMFIPVAMRFISHNISLQSKSMQYIDTILQNEHVQHWIASAKTETECIQAFD